MVELAKGGVLDRRAQGLVMRKVSKALDRKNAEIWDQDLQIRSLKQKIRLLAPKKRAKVVPISANHRFVIMKEVKAVKERLAKEAAKKGIQIEDVATFDEIMF